MRNLLLRASVFFACIAGSSLAYADVSPPDAQSCDATFTTKKAVGTACSIDGKSGTCQSAEIRESAIPAIDAGPGQPSTQIRCVDSNGTVLDLVNGEEQVPGTATPTGESSSSSSSSGCTTSPATRLAGTSGLALLVPAIIFGLRRRRS